MRRSFLSTDTRSIVLEDSKKAGNYQNDFSIPELLPLLSRDREAVFTEATQHFMQEEKNHAAAVVISASTIYSAVRGNSQLYLVVTDKNDELLYFSLINTSSVFSGLKRPRTAKEEKSDNQAPPERTQLYDTTHQLIGQQFLIHSDMAVMHKTILMLPSNARAFVLHDVNDVLARLPLDEFELHLQTGILAASHLDKTPTIAARKLDSYFMLTPVEPNQPPKCLCFSETSGNSESFKYILKETIARNIMETQSRNHAYILIALALERDQWLLEELRRQLEENANSLVKLASHLQAIKNLLFESALIIKEKRDPGETGFQLRFEKSLLTLYFDAYKFGARSKHNILHQTTAIEELMSCLETSLLDKYPAILNVEINEKLNRNTMANRIICYAGKHPEFIAATQHFIDHIHEQRWPAAEQKKYFTNAGKLLVRLGPAGYAQSQLMFPTKNKDSRVKRSEIEDYYEESLKAMAHRQ